MAKRTNSSNIPAARFVTVVRDVHKRNGSIADVAAELGLKVGSVSTRMSNLRNHKPPVNLPHFTRGGGGGAKLDVDALNEILAE